MSKHTPGPWRKWDYGWITGPNNQTLALATGCGDIDWLNPDDFTLAIAAPDLLEALEELDNHICNNLETNYPTGIDVNDSAFQKARAAIAKARGES